MIAGSLAASALLLVLQTRDLLDAGQGPRLGPVHKEWSSGIKRVRDEAEYDRQLEHGVGS